MATRTSPRSPKGTAKVAKLHRHDDGRIHALSSDGVAVYVVRNSAAGAWLCSCPAGKNGRTSYHVREAMVRFGGFFARPAITAVIVTADPEPEPPTPAAPPALHVCGNCGEVLSEADGIPPFTTIPGRPGAAPWWLCTDYAGCVARGQRVRLAA